MSDVVVGDEPTSSINQALLNDEINQLLTIKQFCAIFPWPSESAMRSYIYRAQELGISDAFVRVGRRVLITPQRFFSLIQQVESRSTKGGYYETASWRKGKVLV